MAVSFRVVTYNIHKGRGVDGRLNVRRIARILEDLDADIVALQEVVAHEESRPERHQPRYLSEELGYHYAIGETRKHRGGIYGNVTLSKRPFELSKHFDLSVGGREQRGMLRTDVPLEGELLHVFNVHLGTGYLERCHQARRLLTDQSIAHPELKGPRVVLGDFNEWIAGPVSRTLRAEFCRADVLAKTVRQRGYPGFLPVLDLDHVYCDRHMKVKDAFFHRNGLTLVASDHLPLVVDLEITRESS